MADIRHVFVLAMENRSFDHLFAFSSGLKLPPPEAQWGMTADATDRAPMDPPHEFEDVALQIGADPPMSGFRQQSYWGVSRQGFAAGALPILTALAGNYFLFDTWFSSVPGPTWPNRFFLHAGSSAGLDNSPSAATTIESETIDSLSFSFPNGTLFQRLEEAGHSWRIYHDDLFPQVLAIKEMIDPFRIDTGKFSWIRAGAKEFLVEDLANDYGVNYTFIEPNYGLSTNGFENGNCQHPIGSMAAGEAFIKYIYESIRNSPVWPNSLLIITYDEHGGFFDHQTPPGAIPPGDGMQNQNRSAHPQNFGFDRLGLRVPVIAVSPWIAKGGLASRAFPGKTFDHTSIIKTVMNLFSVSGTLGAREAAANSFESICALAQMRTDDGKADGKDAAAPLREPLAAAPAQASAATIDPKAMPENTIKAFSRIAMSLDLCTKEATGLPAVAAAHPAFTMDGGAGLAPRAISSARTKRQTFDYIQSVAARVERLKAANVK